MTVACVYFRGHGVWVCGYEAIKRGQTDKIKLGHFRQTDNDDGRVQ